MHSYSQRVTGQELAQKKQRAISRTEVVGFLDRSLSGHVKLACPGSVVRRRLSRGPRAGFRHQNAPLHFSSEMDNLNLHLDHIDRSYANTAVKVLLYESANPVWVDHCSCRFHRAKLA